MLYILNFKKGVAHLYGFNTPNIKNEAAYTAFIE